MSDHYDELLAGRTALLERLSPGAPERDHCPEAADAVHDYLETGTVNPPRAGTFDQYSISNEILQGFRPASPNDVYDHLMRSGHGNPLVIRAVRGARGNLSEHHYFVVANIRGNRVGDRCLRASAFPLHSVPSLRNGN